MIRFSTLNKRRPLVKVYKWINTQVCFAKTNVQFAQVRLLHPRVVDEPMTNETHGLLFEAVVIIVQTNLSGLWLTHMCGCYSSPNITFDSVMDNRDLFVGSRSSFSGILILIRSFCCKSNMCVCYWVKSNFQLKPKLDVELIFYVEFVLEFSVIVIILTTELPKLHER